MHGAPEQLSMNSLAPGRHRADAEPARGRFPAHRARPPLLRGLRRTALPPPVALIPALQRLLADTPGSDRRLAANLTRAVLPGGHLTWHNGTVARGYDTGPGVTPVPRASLRRGLLH